MKKKYWLHACVLGMALLMGTTAHAGVAGVTGFGAVFDPLTVPVGGSSTLTLTITSRDNARDLSFFAGVGGGDIALASPLAVSNSCGGTLTALPGGSVVQLSGGNTLVADATPGHDPFFCQVSAKVTVKSTASPPGNMSMSPRLLDGVLMTIFTPTATLRFVAAAATTAASIPTLSEWGLILLVLAMAGSAFNTMRRKR